MSLLNCWITPKEAIVVVDTFASRPDGRRFPASKLLPVPHINAVLGLRGEMAVLHIIATQVHVLELSTFDELDASMLSLLAGLPDDIKAYSNSIGMDLIAVGWSDSRKSMLGRQFVKFPGRELAVADFVRHVAPPWQPTEPAITADPKHSLQIARLQLKWMRENYGEHAACGGTLTTARVTKRGMTIERDIHFDPEGRHVESKRLAS